MVSCPHQDDAALHALGLLTGTEQEAYLQHAATCAVCRVKAMEYRAVADLLPYGAMPSEPDRALWSAIAGRLADRPEAPARRAAAPWRPRLPAWAAVALVVLSLATALLGWRLAALSAQPAPVAGGVRRVRLHADGPAPGARADLLIWPDGSTDGSPDGSRGGFLMLMAHDLPPVSGSQVYHLWLLQDGRRTSGGTFTVDDAGQGYLYRALETLPQFDAAGVTLEPDPAGSEPRGPRVLAGQA